jgi:hypothetical protein
MFDLSICTISTNEWHFLSQCISSIRSEVDNSFKVQLVVVNNCSADFDYSLLSSSDDPFLKIEVINNTEKKTFAANNNMAIKKSESKNLLILNPDTIIHGGTLKYMVNFLNKSPEVGAATCKMTFPDGNFQENCRRFIKLKYLVASRLKTWRIIDLKKITDDYIMCREGDSEAKEVDYILGACMFVKKKLFDEVGLFDERFILYAEDTDLCYRIRRANWKIFYVPNVSITHYYARTAARNIFSKASFLQVYTALLFYLKHYWGIIK